MPPIPAAPPVLESPDSVAPSSPWRRRLAGLLLAVHVLSPQVGLAQTVAAAVAADKRPGIVGTASLPIINIAPPNSAGLSHNQYQSFNVPSGGTVFNNSASGSTSQLAGPLAGNPNLANGTARIILNEVLGNTPSSLLGSMEVAGDPARLIIANPNGITCSGCGFINTPFVQLTTGKLGFDSQGGLTLDVQGGTIAIGPQGLSALAARLDLIGSGVVINGPTRNVVQLNLVAGIELFLAGGFR